MVYESPHCPGIVESTNLPTDNANEIRVLAVRQPWASLIVEGLKTIEVRSKPTNIRGRVAIYTSAKKPTHEEISELFHYFGDQQRQCYDSEGRVLKDNKEMFEYFGRHSALVHSFLSNSEHKKLSGKIIGTVEIVASSSCNDDLEYDLYKKEHLAPIEVVLKNKLRIEYGDLYFWHLRRPVKFSEPIPYKPPKGAVVWSKTTLPEGY
ncbi:MAG: ASCH domain-containing protein [Methanobacterium sp.]